jgi:hypothetical protein
LFNHNKMPVKRKHRMWQMYNILNEGLRAEDLKDMVYPLFEVDAYQSKMGEDRDVCVISFNVRDRAPAKDLMEFIEKGYSFVLDADVSSGENDNGEYNVFVELPRTSRLSEHIKEITYGVRKLTGIEDFKFKYYKQSGVHEATEAELKSIIPADAGAYDGLMNKYRTEDVKRFFSKTLMDDFTLDGDVITIHKPFNQKIQLRMVQQGAKESVLENTTDAITIDEKSTSEIFWLTKVLGDYNINKIGESFVFENGDNAMLLQRIE